MCLVENILCCAAALVAENNVMGVGEASARLGCPCAPDQRLSIVCVSVLSSKLCYRPSPVVLSPCFPIEHWYPLSLSLSLFVEPLSLFLFVLSLPLVQGLGGPQISHAHTDFSDTLNFANFSTTTDIHSFEQFASCLLWSTLNTH